jgi:predicted lipoprotein with Yx(FWY)xxD motif
MEFTNSIAVAVVGLTLALTGSIVHAQPKVMNGMLTDSAGLTLYVFDNDTTVPGKSACTGPCLNMWAPFFAMSGAKALGDYSLITRDDGKQQWAYKGKPLYRWYNDKSRAIKTVTVFVRLGTSQDRKGYNIVGPVR